MGFGIGGQLDLKSQEKEQGFFKKIASSITGEKAGDMIASLGDGLDQPEKAYVDNTNGKEAVKAAPSQFNPFNVFRFRKFGVGDDYNLKNHSDSNLFGSSNIGGISEEENKATANIAQYIKNAVSPSTGKKYDVNEYQRKTRNPTANQIIETFKELKDGGAGDVLGATPYAYNDFIYCRDYGKIPNNRLVTLRRYPWPVDDSLIMYDPTRQDLTPVPIAQALTWYGSGTGNELNSLLPISWDMEWSVKTSKVQSIEGNEVLIDDIIAGLGIEGEGAQTALRTGVAAASGDNEARALEIAGYDAKLQEYIRNAYSDEGPYWNRVLGPVNVINSTRMRERGMGNKMFKTPISMQFTYALRSFNFVNPRIAFLDLLTNFLTLTYNTAPFWGGGYRYFKKPGVAVSNPGGDLIEQGKVIEGLKETLSYWAQSTSGVINDIINEIGAQFTNNTTAGGTNTSTYQGTELKNQSGKVEGAAKDVLNLLAAGRAADLMQAPLSYRSLLEGRPVGEWHMVVGNPLDPMAVMGNLICTSCEIKFSEALGADDFPKEVTFNVTLEHGKPRAKQDIESIFNLGGGPLSFSKLKPPSSAQQTFQKGQDNIPSGVKENPDQGKASDPDSDLVKETALDVEQNSDSADIAEAGVNIYRSRVANHYGIPYGDSSVLNDYIKKTRT